MRGARHMMLTHGLTTVVEITVTVSAIRTGQDGCWATGPRIFKIGLGFVMLPVTATSPSAAQISKTVIRGATSR